MRAQDGQGTVEYIAVVLLVAAVIAAAAALVVTSGLGERVMSAFRHALCVVTGEACESASDEIASRPCVRASREHVDGGHLRVLVLRLGNRSVLLRERLSDGTVAVTLVDEPAIGAEVGAGVEAHVRWGSRSLAVGSELRAAVLAGRASGRTWIAADDAAADRLVLQVRQAERSRRPESSVAAGDHYNVSMAPMPREVQAPEAEVTFSERRSSLSVDFRAATRRVEVHLSRHEAYGERIDHRTGRRTVYISASSAGRGKVSFAAKGSAESQERYGITFDRSGRPVDFSVLSVLDVEGSVGLPPQLSEIAGRLRIPLRGEKHIETEQHLDLTDPANADAAQAFLGHFGDGPLGIRMSARVLRGRLEASGTLRVRTYGADTGAHQVGGDAVLVGGEVGSEERSADLVAAVMRAPDGTWVPDTECLPG